MVWSQYVYGSCKNTISATCSYAVENTKQLYSISDLEQLGVNSASQFFKQKVLVHSCCLFVCIKCQILIWEWDFVCQPQYIPQIYDFLEVYNYDLFHVQNRINIVCET